MSDPDGMGATPTHQADTEALDHELWEAEGVLRVPPRVGGVADASAEEDKYAVERGAVRTSHTQEKRREGSLGSTAPPSTPATRGPWSRTTSLKDWYPDEHPFIKNRRDSDDPNETPYTLTTSGHPLYKKTYMPAMLQSREPIGFNVNRGTTYIDYPIRLPQELTTRQAYYMQAIMAPNPLVVGLRQDSDKVFSKPLYVSAVYQFDGKPTYATGDMDFLKIDAEGQEFTDRLID